jgi:two-component system, sensor histidine kinase and response regulator
MLKSPPPIQGYFSLKTFQSLRDLWQQMVAVVADDVQIFTEADILESKDNTRQFSLIRSSKFNALLSSKLINLANLQQRSIEITFTSADIDKFITSHLGHLLENRLTLIPKKCANDSQLQTYFTQLLLATIASDRLTEKEIRLQQQVAESNLLKHIANRIHGTLDLSVILQSTVEQVQNFLHADRLVIFQFTFKRRAGEVTQASLDTYREIGTVAYEALISSDVDSVLNLTEEDVCFSEIELWDKYENGICKAIDDIESTYQFHPCLLEFLRRHQVKSKLVVPIVVNGGLWGLLIAHQCKCVRHWEGREIQFLKQVAKHLAFAIYHAEIYIASQHQTKSLEQLVNERTQELRDAMIVAQTANQSKTEFLALLSHELRTPLTTILGLSATLLRLPDTNLTVRQRTYLETIHNSGDHLSELIDDILDFYKLEVGKTFLKISEFSISKLLKQIFEIVRTKAETAKIDLQLQIIKDGEDITNIGGRDLRFRGDTKRIRQILLNLLINAIKFTPEQGTVILRTWLEERYAVFEIEDSGIGIAPEQIPRVFRKFQQLQSTYDRDYAGMGLGLAISQQLVELHGGWIDVESTLGSGSTFTVWLASQSLQLGEAPPWDEIDREIALQDPDLHPLPNRIILVEQDETLANFLCDILTAGRYQVTWLLSADSAFRQISVLQPDLVVIDLGIGTKIADRIVSNIRKSIDIRDTKIIAIATKEEMLTEIVQQYVDDYVWKQVNPEQLLKKITKLLTRSSSS